MIKSKSLIPKINKSSWITLNVGGRQFLTTKHTLLKSPSIFRQFLIDEPTEKIPAYRPKFWSQKYKKWRSPPKLNLDVQAYYQIRQKEPNSFYVDRDPICFAVVLNFMRHGKLIYTKDVSITGIMEEASYFQVEELIDIIEGISGIKRADLPIATPLYMPQRTTQDEKQAIQQISEERLRELEEQKKELADQLALIEEEKALVEQAAAEAEAKAVMLAEMNETLKEESSDTTNSQNDGIEKRDKQDEAGKITLPKE